MGACNEKADNSSCFKAYDIRGVVPDEIDASFAFRLGASCRAAFGVHKAVIGRDARISSPMLAEAFASGLASAGIRTFTLGLCGTEEIYHATANGDFDFGIMITGSHNPANQNGFKFIRRGAVPVSAKNGLDNLKKIMRLIKASESSISTSADPVSFRTDYVSWLCDYAKIDPAGKPLRVLANAGNGCAGPVLKALANRLPFEFIPLQYEPDGNFPNGVPNPLLSDRREDTSRAVLQSHADLGVAFDGDFDRCFFFDEDGNFAEGYYIVGILASSLLGEHPGEKIIHDPRLYWNTREMVSAAGGKPVMGRAGHALMKEKMRAENALYGGEMSAHHYFRDFAYCDSGMLTMLLMLRYLQNSSQSLGEIISNRAQAYPCSGEINFHPENPKEIIEKVWNNLLPSSAKQDRLDGINMEFGEWRFNLRPSSTESLLRLNVETRGNPLLLEDKIAELSAMICEKSI